MEELVPESGLRGIIAGLPMSDATIPLASPTQFAYTYCKTRVDTTCPSLIFTPIKRAADFGLGVEQQFGSGFHHHYLIGVTC
jgi:hypothetical protein